MPRKKRISDQESKALIHPLQASVFQNGASARDFLRSPAAFAKKIGVSLESLACPPDAHAAFKRGEEFAKEVKAKGITLDEQSINELKKIANLHFGRDYEAVFIPFGLQFRERVKIRSNQKWTATGTYSITWLDHSPDTDG